MINRVVLVGRLTRDPELRRSTSGVAVTSFTIAVDNRFAKQEQSKADFIPVVCFQRTAEIVCDFTRKGSLVAVEGRLQQRSYENKENQKVNVIEVIADNVQMLESKNTSESRVQAAPNQSAPYVAQPKQQEATYESQPYNNYDVSDDDLPF